ncbi:hypothetical protein Scep_020884 [Stephania cephalantha]|uniref:Peptidase C1A papain C-terminal domain-containing protein n=1 Tax=Stephania cephalantha TaxID=152367 RepID=A0AAP0I133_9MAGN
MAFRYVVSNEGLTTDEDYPYKAKNGTCDAQKAVQRAETLMGVLAKPGSSSSGGH